MFMNKAKNIAALIAAVALITLPANVFAQNTQDDQSEILDGIKTAEAQQFTMQQWSELSKRERQITVLAAVEGLIMAATAPEYPADFISLECLSQNTPKDIEKSLRSIADEFEQIAFMDVFLAVTKCYQQENNKDISGVDLLKGE